MKRILALILLVLIFPSIVYAEVTGYKTEAISPTAIKATWTGEPEGDMAIWKPGEWLLTHELFFVPTTAREYTFTGLKANTVYDSIAPSSKTFAESRTLEEHIYDRLSASKTAVEPIYLPPGTKEIHVAVMKNLAGENLSYLNLPANTTSYTPPAGQPVVDMEAWKGELETIGGWAGRLETTPAKEHEGAINVTASNTTIEGKTISGASGACITVQTGLTNITIRNDTIENCGSDGIHFVRPGNTGSGNYTHESHIEGNTIRNVGSSDTEANDITLYANSTTVANNNLSATPNDAIDLWGDHLTLTGNDIHDVSNTHGNHNDAFQSWDGYYGSNGDGAQGNPLTNLVIEGNRIENVTGSNSHGLIVEGPGYENLTIKKNVWKNVGSIGLILGVWEEESEKEASSVVNVKVEANAFCTAGPGDGVEFNGRKGSGSLIGNWLIKSDTYFHTGMTNTREGNDYYESESNLALGTGDNHNAVTCAEAEAKAKGEAKSSILVGLNAGGWGQSGQEDVASGGTQAVRMQEHETGEISEWTKLGVKSIIDFEGSESGEVKAINASSYAAHVVAEVKAHPDTYAVEILNEPYGQWYWTNARSTANEEAYGRLVTTVHEALVGNFGSARPLELASYGDPQTNYIQHTPSSSYDGVTVHPYSNGGYGTKGEGNHSLVETAESYTKKPIYATEVGWTLESVNLTEQANFIYTFVNWLRGTGYVADVNIYNYREEVWGVEKHPSPYEKRPAWYALKEAAKGEACTVCS